jgi:hypothetical protein
MALLRLDELQRIVDVHDVSSFYMYVYKMLPCAKVSRAQQQTCGAFNALRP